MVPAYFFLIFFKTVFLVTFFGAMHGIFLLPVLLSLLGPGSCRKQKKTSEKQLHSPDNHLHLSFPQSLSGNPQNGTAVPSLVVSCYKDLGKGTSVEESSEFSLNKGIASHSGPNGVPINNSNISGMVIPIAKEYSNSGYVSDNINTIER